MLPPPEHGPQLDAMNRIGVTSLLTQPPPPQLLPTVTQTCQFLATFFPTRPRDVQWLYHTPRYAPYSSDSTPVARIVCSITPTAGVYTAMHKSFRDHIPPLAFLHRPFTLDRKRLPRGACVVSSHVGFDEVLTVGWNVALSLRLGMRVDDSVCIQGYKGDPERRIGIVAPLVVPTTLGTFADSIEREFGRWDDIYGATRDSLPDMAKQIKVVAIMNAFHPEEVQRVAEAAYANGWISDPDEGDGIVYLTGQAREPGLVAAEEKKMKVFCVGHRTCEEWGIRYLASELRREFPMLEVHEMYENEEPRPLRNPNLDLSKAIPTSDQPN